MPARLLLTVCSALALILAACDATPTEVAEDPSPTPSPTAAEETPDADPDDDALERIAEAAATTSEEGSARFVITVEASGTGTGEGTQPFGAEGEEDFREERRRITLQGPQGDLEMLVDGSTVYFQLPATEDDDWVRVELDQLIGTDIGFGGPGGLPFQSPHANLMVLSDTAVRAAQSAEEDISGEPTTRYDVTLDLQAMTEQVEDATDTDGQAGDALSQVGAEELDMTVWVDGEDRIRRLAYTIDLDQLEVQGEVSTESPEAGADTEVDAEPRGEVTVTIHYSDFGASVDVDLPDEEQVIDLDEEELRRSFQQPSS